MTTTDDQLGTADFLGLEARIEGIKYKAIAPMGSAAVVTVSFNAHGKRDLLAQLAENIGGGVFVGWGFPQMTLDFQDANAQAFADPAQQPVRQMITPDGEIILPHGFRPGRPLRLQCAICGTPERHAIHSEESRRMVHDQTDDAQGAQP